MEEFEIKCPHCQCPLSAQEEWIGMETVCPSCQQKFVIQQNQPAAPAPAPAETISGGTFTFVCPSCEAVAELPVSLLGQEYECQMCFEKHIAEATTERQCPVCGQTIKYHATVCKFCKADLTKVPPPSAPKPEETFVFICPECDTAAELPLSAKGQEYTCKACCETTVAEPAEERDCPFCGGKINIKATLCNHCKSKITPLQIKNISSGPSTGNKSVVGIGEKITKYAQRIPSIRGKIKNFYEVIFAKLKLCFQKPNKNFSLEQDLSAADKKCPHCGSELEIPDELIGQEIECPVCEKTFTIYNRASKLSAYKKMGFIFVCVLLVVGVVAIIVGQRYDIFRRSNERKQVSETNEQVVDDRQKQESANERKQVSETNEQVVDDRQKQESAKHLQGAFGISFGQKMTDGEKDGEYEINPPKPSSIFVKYKVSCNENGEIYRIYGETKEEPIPILIEMTKASKHFQSIQLALQEKYGPYYLAKRVNKDNIVYDFGYRNIILKIRTYHKYSMELCCLSVEYLDINKERRHEQYKEENRKREKLIREANERRKILNNAEALQNSL